MIPTLSLIFALCALLAFLVGAVQLQPPAATPINKIHWASVGLAFLTLVYLLTRA